MGLIGAAFGLGFVIGPAIGGVLSTKVSPSAPFFFVAILCLVNALLVYLFLPESRTAEQRTQHRDEQSVGDMLAHADAPLFKTVVATYVVSLMAFSIMTAIFSLFANDRFGMDELHVGYVMFAVGLVGVVMQGGVIR